MPGGWALNFSGRVCGLDFQNVGLANWYLALKEGVYWLKMSNFGGLWAEISKFGGLKAKILAKIEAVEAKISKFSHKGDLWTDTFAWNGTLANYRRCKKGVFRATLPHIPFLGQCPRALMATKHQGWKCIYMYMWYSKKKKCVKRVSPVLSYSYNASWIRRIWMGFTSKKIGIKCAMYMYDQYVKNYLF